MSSLFPKAIFFTLIELVLLDQTFILISDAASDHKYVFYQYRVLFPIIEISQ